MRLFEQVARKALLQLDAERAHSLGIKALKSGALGVSQRRDKPGLASQIAGISFPNPIGIAAGFDKNGEVPDALLKRGMGFAEIGTVTPLPQSGNPKPRIFRLPEEHAVINRLGFNNHGHEVVYQRLIARRKRDGVIGVNIGANKTSDDFVADYVKGVQKFSDVATYFTANISSPNTPGLRDLQGADALRHLLAKLCETRNIEVEKRGRPLPVFLKIAPDITEAEIEDIARETLASGIDGLIVSNTTIARDKIAGHRLATEAGGLSGAPLFNASTLVLAKMRQAIGPDFPIIGVGGITDGASALQKIRAGANLLQLYSGLVYRGFDLIDEIKDVLETAIHHEKVDTIADLVGLDTDNLTLST